VREGRFAYKHNTSAQSSLSSVKMLVAHGNPPFGESLYLYISHYANTFEQTFGNIKEAKPSHFDPSLPGRQAQCDTHWAKEETVPIFASVGKPPSGELTRATIERL